MRSRGLSSASFSRYPWVVAVLLLLVWMLNYLDRQVIFSLFPLLQREMSVTSFQLGLLGTAFLWTYSFTSPFSGHLADRYGAKPLICASLLVWSVVTFLTGHAHSFSQLITLRCLMGISESCYLPAGLAMISALHGPRTRSRAISLHYSGTYIGTILGGWLGGWGAARYGWRPVFLIFGLIGCVYAVVLFVVLRQAGGSKDTAAVEKKPGLFVSVPILLRAPGFRAMLATFSIASICDWAIYAWMPLYLYEVFHLSLANAGLSATLYIRAGGFAGLFIGGVLADRWAARNRRARSLTQTAGLLLAAPCLMLSGHARGPMLLYLAMAAFGVGKGMYDGNNMPVLCERVPAHLRATSFGLLNFAGTLAGGAIAAIAGKLKDMVGLGVVFVGCGVLLLAGCLLTATLPTDQQMEEQLS